MKTGVVLKNVDNTVSSEDLALINKYTRRELSADEVYIFSVVLCDNDIDRDFERFTVESLFELEKLFVGKTGILDHCASAKNQTARIFSCKVENVEGRKTATGDEYFRLVAKAYIPRSEKNADIILSLDSGITKEVSVGCAVKSTLCSICSADIHSPACTHIKGEEYGSKLCYGELTEPYDAYEFSFVAIPAQKNAGVIKSYLHIDKENKTMKDLIEAINSYEELTLSGAQTKSLSDYIRSLESQAEDGKLYKEQLALSVQKAMSVSQPQIKTATLKGILSKLSVSELMELSTAFTKKQNEEAPLCVQLKSKNADETTKSATSKNNHFTI